nr:hypothetical protein [Asgard group archaeon]
MTIQKVGTDALGNIGSLACSKGNPFVDAVSLFLTTNDFEFATKASFATQADWETGIKAKKIFPLHGIVEFEDQSEDSQYYESPTGVRIPRRLGKYRHMYMFNKGLEVHKALQSFRNANLKCFAVDAAGNISGTSPDGVKVTGMDIEMINPEKMKSALQDNTPAWTPVAVDLADAKEWNENGIFVNPSWNPLLEEPVTDVEISVVSATATEIVLKVAYYKGLQDDGSDDLIGVEGIEEADFVFTTTTPDVGYTDNGDGTYKFIGAAMVSGS